MRRRNLLATMKLLPAGLLAACASPAPTPESAGRPCGSGGSRYRDLVMIPMRDGVRLAASIWLPDTDGPVPAILMRSLHRRRYAEQGRIREMLVRAGYAFVNSDVRGRFESEGEFDPTYGEQDGRDGYDTIRWIVEQPWSDGRVGTFGLSHMAYYQTSTAREDPPALRAMATWTGGYRMGGTPENPPPRGGGVVRLSTLVVWMSREAEAVLDRIEYEQGKDVTAARRALRRMHSQPGETYEHLPLLDAPVARHGGLRELVRYRLENDARNSRAGRIEDLRHVDTPVFHECGWFDHAAWGQLEAFQALQREAGTEAARSGQHMVIGPWQHGMVFHDRLGDFWFGPEATNAGSGIDELQVKFFDKYVRGMAVDLPRVRYFVMGLNEWREADAWPPPHVKERRFYIGSRRGANSADGDGRLYVSPAQETASDRFDYDPHDPVPTLGGSFSAPLMVPGVIPGPIEQSPVERREDVLCYTSDPFDRDIEISGPLSVRLFVATSAVDTDFTAKLTHVYPDGRSYNFGEGILRLSGRSFSGEAEPVEPGRTYEIVISLGYTSIVISEGHALRLQVSSSSFPQWDRNMNTGSPLGTDEQGIVARQVVHHGGPMSSHLSVHAADWRDSG